MRDHSIGEPLYNIVIPMFQLLLEFITKAFMVEEFSTKELTVADLAHDRNCRAVMLNVAN